MNMYEFTVVSSCPDADIALLTERLFEAGCDDATVSLQKGVAVIEFDREAKNFSHALSSAVSNVRSAGVEVLHIAPDHLVSLSDIAARAGVSRAAVSNYARGVRATDFPPPICRVTTDTPLWDWVDVARWLVRQTGRLTIDDVVQARVVRRENEILRQRVHFRAAHLELAG
jgi:transcriptional regulator with XRE-family HTH domain